MNNSEIIIYKTKDGKTKIDVKMENDTVWLTQEQMAMLFSKGRSTITEHINNVFKEGELDEKSVCRESRQSHSFGRESNVKYYNLDVIISVGYRVKSLQGTQFRIWATQRLKEYIIKGFTLDDERLKNPGGRPDYFDEFLARIRDIRASEKRFYQKLKDLFSLSKDYDKTDKATQMFFATVQNKLLYAVTGKTAAEIILSRADANQPNMALTNWQGKIVRKEDIYIAKNYLNEDEIDNLNRMVTIFLEMAELRVKNRQNIDMKYWKENVDEIIKFNEKEVLNSKGRISNKDMEKKVREIYKKFNSSRKILEARVADEDDIKELEILEHSKKRI
jgi:hypothetical protein